MPMIIIYADRKTVNGYACDVVISGLQKFIRRADTARALACANELALTDRELFEYMWSRLMVVSVEDIGMGDPMASVRVYNRYQQHKNTVNSAKDEKQLYYEAVIDLCNCNKDRGSCILAQLVRTLSKDRVIEDDVDQLHYHLCNGETEQAAISAFAIATRGPEHYDGLWSCISDFAEKELSFEPNALTVVKTLNCMRKENYKDNGIHPMYFTHAIRYLCNLKNGICLNIKEHGCEMTEACSPTDLTFPSYVFDKHTQLGQDRGMDELHFLTYCATVIPEVNDDNNDWTQRLLKMVKGGLYG